MAIVERLVWDPGVLGDLFDLAEPFVERASADVLDAMQLELPASRDGSNGRPPGYARSRLRRLGRGRDATGPFRDVGTDATTPDGTSYPAILEHGSKPHIIESHGPYPLRNRHTGQVFGRVVQHPGTRADPWARRSAQTIHGRRYR